MTNEKQRCETCKGKRKVLDGRNGNNQRSIDCPDCQPEAPTPGEIGEVLDWLEEMVEYLPEEATRKAAHANLSMLREVYRCGRDLLELVENQRDVEIVYSPNLNRWIVYVKSGNWIGNEQVSFQALGNSDWCHTVPRALEAAVKEMKQPNCTGKEGEGKGQNNDQ